MALTDPRKEGECGGALSPASAFVYKCRFSGRKVKPPHAARTVKPRKVTGSSRSPSPRGEGGGGSGGILTRTRSQTRANEGEGGGGGLVAVAPPDENPYKVTVPRVAVPVIFG